MGKVFAFHGGVHPPENKHQSTGLPIQPGPVPGKVRLPVQQHIGAPANVVVEVGQRVLKGQLIAEPSARMSAAIHASVSGTVTAIGQMPVAHSSGMDALCVEIENDRQDEWVPHAGLGDYHSLNGHELADFIRGKGVAGMGGAGFPTDVKLHVGDHHIVNTLIINAAECEPYITADDMLMRERADQVISGIEVICHMLRPSHVMIGIEDNKPQAIRALQQAAQGNRHNIDVVVVPTKYPSGGEKQLIKLLTGVEVPSGGIPADVGIVCQNVGTTVAIHRAVNHGEPLVSRIVTMTGDAVARPHNMEVAIGTPFVDLLDAANLKENHLARLVVGGPMMGFTVNDDELPITKTTNCLIAATWDEMPEGNPAQPCIRCGACEQACPAELLPQQLHWFAKGREFEKAKNHNLFDCIECGACSYVCPSEIPLVQYYRFAKAEIRQEEAEARKAEHAKQRYEARIARQEAEKAEKEARRKQRAEEAAKAQAARKDKDLAAAGNTPAAPAATDVKALKTAAAVARTKLKKAEKAVVTARETGAENLAELEAALQAAQQKTDAAQQALADAENGGGTAAGAAPVLDLKQLKTNAAVARTKLKQAEKALKNAEDKGLDGIDKLRETLSQLQAKADAAQKAYDDAQQTPAAAPVVDIKQLKTNAAVARTKLKQAEKALAKAQDSGEGDIAALEARVAEQQAKTDAAQKAYDEAESGGGAPAAPAAPAVSADQLAELQSDVDALQAKVDKGQSALDAAIESGSPAADKMKAGVEKLRAKLDEVKKALADAQGAGQSAAPAASAEQLAELQSDIDALQAKVDKGQAALDMAIEKGLPTADKMKPGVEKLRAKLADAKQALADAQGAGQSAAPAVSAEQLAELQADIDALQAKVDKGQAALDMAIEKGLPTADKMKPGVEKLRAKLADAKQALADAQGAGQSNAPAGASPEQIAELQADVDTLQAKVDKGQAALDMAIEKGLPTADKMKPGVEKLRAKLDEAKQALADAQGTGSAASAVNPAQLAELKADVDTLQAKVDKGQAALDMAIEKGLPTADKMKPGVEKLRDKLNAAIAEYRAAGGEIAAPSQPEPEPEAEPELDIKALKQQVSIMRTKLRKAEKAVEEAQDAGEDSAALEAEQQQLQQRYDDAKTAFEAAEAKQVDAAAAEGIDLKQLKIDAAMARAAVTKAERALAKVTEPDDQQEQLAQELEAAKQKADQLNATLSRFE